MTRFLAPELNFERSSFVYVTISWKYVLSTAVEGRFYCNGIIGRSLAPST